MTALTDPEDGPPNELPATRPDASDRPLPPDAKLPHDLAAEAETERPRPPETVDEKLDWIMATLRDLADSQLAHAILLRDLGQGALDNKGELAALKGDVGVIGKELHVMRTEFTLMRREQTEQHVVTAETAGRVQTIHEFVQAESQRVEQQGASIIELQRAEEQRQAASPQR